MCVLRINVPSDHRADLPHGCSYEAPSRSTQKRARARTRIHCSPRCVQRAQHAAACSRRLHVHGEPLAFDPRSCPQGHMAVLPTVQTIEPCCVVAATDCCACTVLSAERLACATASFRYPGYPSAPIAPLTHPKPSADQRTSAAAAIGAHQTATAAPSSPRRRSQRELCCWRQQHSCARACTAPQWIRMPYSSSTAERSADEQYVASGSVSPPCMRAYTCRAPWHTHLSCDIHLPRKIQRRAGTQHSRAWQRQPAAQGIAWRCARLHA